MTRALQFLNMVEEAVIERGRPFDHYITLATKAALTIPDGVPVEAAVHGFLQELYGGRLRSQRGCSAPPEAEGREI
jgi:hypothetical protein